MRSVNLDVTGGAILISQRRLIVKIRSVGRANLMRVAVTLETELSHTRTREQFLVSRTVRRVAGRAAFDLQWRMLEDKWPLLVSVTLQTPRISAGREACLLKLKTAVRIVTITALDLSFEHLVMKRPAKLRFCLTVTTNTELRLTPAQHVYGEQIRISSCCFGQECV